jgi:LPS-assembly protein
MAYSNSMLLLSLALLLAPVSLAQDENVLVTCGARTPDAVALAESIERGVIRCAEGAVVVYQDVRIEADWMEFDPATKQLTAGDKGRFTRGGEELTVGRLSFNLETKAGTFDNVSGQIEGLYIKAGNYERLADGRWHLIKPSATACAGDCPGWHFTWREVTITPGKSASGKGMAFRFYSVPLFYFPKFSVPTATRDRASGFLVPSVAGSTSKGRSFRGSYFWAINRSYDATITGEYFSKRGPTGLIDFRAVPNPARLMSAYSRSTVRP